MRRTVPLTLVEAYNSFPRSVRAGFMFKFRSDSWQKAQADSFQGREMQVVSPDHEYHHRGPLSIYCSVEIATTSSLRLIESLGPVYVCLGRAGWDPVLGPMNEKLKDSVTFCVWSL